MTLNPEFPETSAGLRLRKVSLDFLNNDTWLVFFKSVKMKAPMCTYNDTYQRLLVSQISAVNSVVDKTIWTDGSRVIPVTAKCRSCCHGSQHWTNTDPSPKKPKVFTQVQQIPFQERVLAAGETEDEDLSRAPALGSDLNPPSWDSSVPWARGGLLGCWLCSQGITLANRHWSFS